MGMMQKDGQYNDENIMSSLQNIMRKLCNELKADSHNDYVPHEMIYLNFFS